MSPAKPGLDLRLFNAGSKGPDKRSLCTRTGLLRLQKSAQVKTPLCGDVTQFGRNRAGISRQAALLVAFGLWRLLQVIEATLDRVPSDIKRSDRTAMQAGLAGAVQAG
jgi:hypothetical protein